ncbi:MAG: hypothetical protein ACHQQQ_08705 [Bacteroidota bacterium]
MKRYFLNIALFIALLAVGSTGKAVSQTAHSSDWTLSMLRGSWEFHTFEDKWTLVFESDHNLIIDRNDANYALLPGSIRVTTGNESTEYPYTLTGSNLTLRLPDGSDRTYKKTGDGDAEATVKGIVYATIDSTMRKAHLSFDGNHTFSIADEIGEDAGIYRVEGSTIYLTLNDTTTYATQIRSWNDDGSLDEIVFDGRIFVSEKPAVTYVDNTPTGGYTLPPMWIAIPSPPPSHPPEPAYPINPTPPPAPTTPVASIPGRQGSTPAFNPVLTGGSRRPPLK